MKKLGLIIIMCCLIGGCGIFPLHTDAEMKYQWFQQQQMVDYIWHNQMELYKVRFAACH
jgi:hypothetical protein